LWFGWHVRKESNVQHLYQIVFGVTNPSPRYASWFYSHGQSCRAWTSFSAFCKFVSPLSALVISNLSNPSFQKVQGLPPVQVSLNFLPNIVIGLIINPLTGLFIQRVSAYQLLVISSIIAALSPLAMILIDPSWSFWRCAFWAILLSPVSVDGMFSAALILCPSFLEFS
jgi:hypothetical protein